MNNQQIPPQILEAIYIEAAKYRGHDYNSTGQCSQRGFEDGARFGYELADSYHRHEHELFSHKIGGQMIALQAENHKLREALEKISKVKYGLELHDSDEYKLEHWSRQALEYEAIAREALNTNKSEG